MYLSSASSAICQEKLSPSALRLPKNCINCWRLRGIPNTATCKLGNSFFAPTIFTPTPAAPDEITYFTPFPSAKS